MFISGRVYRIASQHEAWTGSFQVSHKILIIIKITCFSWDVFSIIHVVTVHGKKEVNLQRRMMSCVLGVFYEREQASASTLLM